MENDLALRIENVSKVYKLYNSHLDRLKEALNPFGGKYHQEFYALHDISLSVKKGETLGIIGRNGSGKSTLLQIITGILQPSSGTVELNGKVSALLELGSGFNPEFTGIQNIYFNGSIMGYSKPEIDERLDEIIAFAEIGEFVYQPVKIYSSGMSLRLAFAVAINVDPDILIIDEALAVGDAKFQKKCFDKMKAFKRKGKTIVLVTHSRIKGFASMGLVLNNGHQFFIGDAEQADLRYMQLLYPEQNDLKENIDRNENIRKTVRGESNDSNRIKNNVEEVKYCLRIAPNEDDSKKSFGAGGAWINWIRILGLKEPNVFCGGETIKLDISYAWDSKQMKKLVNIEKLQSNLIFGIAFENIQGITITGFVTTLMDRENVDVDPKKEMNCIMTYEVKLPLLAAGDYFLTPAIALGSQEHHIPLKRYENLIHLYSHPIEKWIFGLMNWDVVISKV